MDQSTDGKGIILIAPGRISTAEALILRAMIKDDICAVLSSPDFIVYDELPLDVSIIIAARDAIREPTPSAREYYRKITTSYRPTYRVQGTLFRYDPKVEHARRKVTQWHSKPAPIRKCFRQLKTFKNLRFRRIK